MAEIPEIIVRTRSLLLLRGFEVIEFFEFEGRWEMYPTKKKSEDVTLLSVVRIFKEPKVVGVAVVRELAAKMEEMEAQAGVLVGGTRFTPAAKKHAKVARVELVEGGYASFELFGHELVPNHTIASDDEVQLVLGHYGIERPKLPRIFRDDPAARVLDAKPGQVVRIVRESPTAGKVFYYRLVVDSKR